MRIKDLLETDRLGDLNPVQRWMVFGEYEEMMCVDAKFFAHGECGKLEDTIHTWYVPYNFQQTIVPGDLLVVETTGGHGVSFGVVVNMPYWRTLAELMETGHPYCGVVACLDNFKLANGKVTYEIDLE